MKELFTDRLKYFHYFNLDDEKKHILYNGECWCKPIITSKSVMHNNITEERSWKIVRVQYTEVKNGNTSK